MTDQHGHAAYCCTRCPATFETPALRSIHGATHNRPMALVSLADVEAAKRVLGSLGETHPHVAHLEGADLCSHRLAGNGKPLDQFDTVLPVFEATPYRHHVFTLDTSHSYSSTWCRCGNGENSIVHPACVEEVLQ